MRALTPAVDMHPKVVVAPEAGLIVDRIVVLTVYQILARRKLPCITIVLQVIKQVPHRKLTRKAGINWKFLGKRVNS